MMTTLEISNIKKYRVWATTPYIYALNLSLKYNEEINIIQEIN